MSLQIPQPTAVLEAAKRIAEVANHTPVHTSRTLNQQTGHKIFLKCENFQRVGAFKFRGAYNAVSQLSAAQKAAGVVTHSSGNHAQGLALAAKLLGVKATIVMPDDAPAIKKAATAGYGATIISCPAAEREAICAQQVREHGYTLIHPYDNPNIIAGAGTAALELLQEVGPLDLLFTPVGGAGLLSGTALAAAAIQPHCRVIGVEPAIANDAQQSWQRGEIVRLTAVSNTIADGLRTCFVGEHNLPILRQYVSNILTVTEEEIAATLRFLWTRLKLVVEPSAAVALVPAFMGKIDPPGQRIGIILSGGNVDVAQIAPLFED
ncbi:pyridoxal-phosphate dependent enzyme [Candidatus Leptofilum sp.]|uniref:pyridoxal-phosphate dependent enzyme n=1 Tax=Candidatus Leptofilum sp. TaxID=3241576 RepID=UPI003B5AF2C4